MADEEKKDVVDVEVTEEKQEDKKEEKKEEEETADWKKELNDAVIFLHHFQFFHF